MKKDGSVSVKDIANRMNISLSTVNKALTGKSGISEKRRKEVLAVSKEMGYECNRVAQSLARNPMVIGVVMPDRWFDYFNDIYEGMKQEFSHLEKYKVRSSVYYTSEKDTKTADNLKKWIIDEEVKAIVLCASAHESADMVDKIITEMKLPVFQIGEEQKHDKTITTVSLDGVMAGKLVADFFSCIYGKNIRAVSLIGFESIESHVEKAQVFKERVESIGGTVYDIKQTNDEPKQAYQCMKELCSKYPDINAVYACTATSSYACEYIADNNLENEISFVGTDMFDSIREYMKNGIIKATVFQKQKKLGATAVRSIYDYLVGTNSFGYEDVHIPDRIVVKPVLYLKSNID